MDCRCKTRYAVCKRQRGMLMTPRGGTAELRIETGRRDEWICKMCDEREVEDVEHFSLHCNGMTEERKEIVRLII